MSGVRRDKRTTAARIIYEEQGEVRFSVQNQCRSLEYRNLLFAIVIGPSGSSS